MPVPANLIHQLSTTATSGDMTLTKVNGKQDFATAFTTGGASVFDYFISNRDAAEWERGTGSMGTTDTLRRDQCLETHAGSTDRITFSAGTKDITCDIPALKQVQGTTLATSGQVAIFDTTAGNLIKSAGFAPQALLTSGNGIAFSGSTISVESATTAVDGIMEVAEDAEYRANTAGSIALTPAKVWSAAASVALAAAGTVISVEMSTFLTLASRAMAANETLGSPTSPKVGQHFICSVATTTTRTLTLSTMYKLWTGVEVGPYTITTAEKLYVAGFVESSTGMQVTCVGRTSQIS